MLHYTGIGSRHTPNKVLRTMSLLGVALADRGLVLRSGAADGADTEFEKGCDHAHGKKEIYLPWKGFNGHRSELFNIDSHAFSLAESVHPWWKSCNQGARKMHARNCYQVLGLDLNTPSQFVICWTPNGKPIGGTRTAIILADNYDVPVYNLGDPKLKDMTVEQVLEMVLCS